ncbi:MAG: lipopolysaccharide heptosyltransferase II [Legionellales bacterium]|nr:lipopolysaccharide heptosyltransferase II [Legionellales bacterium]
MIMAQSLFKELHKIYNDPIIDVLAPKWCRNVLARMPEVRQSIPMTVGHGKLNLKERYNIAKKLRIENYCEAIVLPNSFKSALIPFFSKIKKRTGWLGEFRHGLLNNSCKLDKKKYTRMVDRFIALAYPLNEERAFNSVCFPELLTSNENIIQLKNRYNLILDKPILAICPGAAFGPAKCWPQEYYSDVINQLKANWQVWLLGSENDSTIANEIQENTNSYCINFVGKTSLEDAIDLISLASIVLSNDSGLMHTAAALDKPLIAFYGPTPEWFAPPLTKKTKSLYTDIYCRPCRERVCPLKHHLCMREILPGTVINYINELTA